MRNIVRKSKATAISMSNLSLCIKIREVIASRPLRYRLRDGSLVTANSVTELSRELGRHGVRGAAKMTANDYQQLGFETPEAMYVGGMCPTGKWCKVIIHVPAPTIEQRAQQAFNAIKDDPTLGPIARELMASMAAIGKKR